MEPVVLSDDATLRKAFETRARVNNCDQALSKPSEAFLLKCLELVQRSRDHSTLALTASQRLHDSQRFWLPQYPLDLQVHIGQFYRTGAWSTLPCVVQPP